MLCHNVLPDECIQVPICDSKGIAACGKLNSGISKVQRKHGSYILSRQALLVHPRVLKTHVERMPHDV